MNIVANFEHRASSSRGKHEGESSFALCDRLGRTRDNSQRQLPTDHDYAVPTREYQTDQSSLKTAPTAARSVLEKTQRQLQKHLHRFRRVDTVTPYQGNALIEPSRWTDVFGMWTGKPAFRRSSHDRASDCKCPRWRLTDMWLRLPPSMSWRWSSALYCQPVASCSAPAARVPG